MISLKLRFYLWKALLIYYRKFAPGFKNGWIMLTGSQLGDRHSHRLIGNGWMAGDKTKTGTILPDGIGVSPSLGPKLPNVSVLYSVLMPKMVDNVLVAARSYLQ